MRLLIVRIGAYGDAIIITPLIRYLKNLGHEIYVLGSKQSLEVLQLNPNISKFILHEKDSVEPEKLGELFKTIAAEEKCDRVIDMCESIEVALALDPAYPMWKWTMKRRKEKCNINYYEYAFTHAYNQHKDILENCRWKFYTVDDARKFYKPEMFFSDEEEVWALEQRQKLLGFKTIMWGLSGSGRQKSYPYVPYIISDIVKQCSNVKVILVGGRNCQILEAGFPNSARIVKRSGDYSFRQSAMLTRHVDLVVSPDTGFLHAAGCCDTPKIGLLTHTTIENITKYFYNDMSIESEAPCAPCFKLINDAETQCPVEYPSTACLCMGIDGMKPERVAKRIGDSICLTPA